MKKKKSYDELYEEYFKKHEEQFKNPLFKSFFDIAQNMELLKKIIRDPNEKNKRKLDELFKAHYFKIRFTSYLSKTIYFNAVNYDKKTKLFSERNQLTLDKPVTQGDGTTMIDIITDHEKMSQDFCIKSPNIEDHITDLMLYRGVEKLTDNQRELLSLLYVYGLTNTEIASILNKTPQAVSRSHKRALKKLKEIIEKTNREDAM